MLVSPLTMLDIKASLGNKPKLRKNGLELDVKKQKQKLKDYIENKVEKFTPEYTIKDYQPIKEKAMAGIDTEKLIGLDIDEEIREDMLTAAVELNQKLTEIIPVNTSQTLFGVDERDPSDFEKSKFIRVMRIVEDPSHIFDLLLSGTVSGLEVDALQNFYPSYYEQLKEQLFGLVAEYKGSASKELSRIQNRDLSTLVGVTRLSPAILTQEKEEEKGAEIKGAENSQSEVTSLLASE